MKILFYLRIVLMGGAERYLLTLLPELKKRNIEVGFFCTEQANNKQIIAHFSKELQKFNIPVYVCKASSPLSLIAARSLHNTIKKEGYNILSAHLIHAEIISALSKMLFRSNCKLVVTKHGYLQQFMDINGLDASKINKLSLSYQVEKFLQLFVTSNFAVSQGLANFFILAGFCKSDKMKVIYHGLNEDFCKNADAPIRYSSNQLLISGRLRKLKGHHFLLEAMKIIHSQIPDVKLIILGDGEEMNNLVEMTAFYGLNDAVVFVGYADEVGNYILGSDVLVAPSMAEAFGLVVLEAYSFGKPVIAFNVTAFNENIIDNETGCLATPYDTTSLADKIIYLLHNKNLATQFGIQGKGLLKDKFSLDNSITNTINFFKNVY